MANDEKKKSVAFKAQSSKGENNEDCNEDESDEEMAFFCKKIQQIHEQEELWKERSIFKEKSINNKYFECGEEGHIIVNCPNKKNDKNKKDKKDDEKKKKKFIKKKRNGQAYFVE